MKLLFDILNKYIEASKARTEEMKARKELLKDKFRETYFQMLVDRIKQEDGKYIKVTISLNGGQDVVVVEPSDRDSNRRKTFWDQYNEVQAARGTN